MLRFIYNVGFFIFSLIYLPTFIAKGKFKGGLRERFGFVPIQIQQKLREKSVVWIHAVSVGEAAQAMVFLKALKENWPDKHFLITTTTATGRETVLKNRSDDDTVLYCPIDGFFAVKRFLNAVRPERVILFETEIWPNLIFELSDRKIPAWIVNGRISDRAFPKYRRVQLFLAPVLRRLKGILAQDEQAKERFISLGAAPDTVHVSGNLKYDWFPKGVFAGEADFFRKALGSNTFLWVAGSTHAGEEEILFDAYCHLKAKYSFFALLLAPRHLDRLSKIEKLAADRNLELVRLSQWKSGQSAGIVVLDKMGALADFYNAADSVFVGGSLVPTGGHNLVEPAYFEKPILFGPFTQNFRQMTELFLKEGAGFEVKDLEMLSAALDKQIADVNFRVGLGQKAKKIIKLHQGATQRSIDFLNA